MTSPEARSAPGPTSRPAGAEPGSARRHGSAHGRSAARPACANSPVHCVTWPGSHRCTVHARLRLMMAADPARGTGPGSPTCGPGRTTGRSPPSCTRRPTAAAIARSRSRRDGAHPAGLQRAAFPFGQPAPDAVGDPVADGVVQARLADRARRADLPRGPGRLAAAGKEHAPGRCRGTQPAPASAQQNAPEQPGCGAAAGGPSPCGRGDPRPPGGGEGGQVGYLQAAGREILSEPPRVAAGRFAGAVAHHGVRQRPGDRQPPDRLPGDAQPPRELRGGQEVRRFLRFRFRWRGPSWWRDERRGQGPGQCLQQLGRDWRVGVVVGCLPC